MFKFRITAVLVLLMFLLGCARSPAPVETEAGPNRLRVVATTTILGDVVAAVGGDGIDLVVLYPRGADVHRFDPTSDDARAIADADLVFVVGLGLDQFVEELVLDAPGGPEVVDVSGGISLLSGSDSLEEAGSVDPHVWMDPNNVIVWVENIASALATADEAGAAGYDSNAAAYIHSLIELDTWIRTQVETLPLADRKLVTDHDSLGYFAAEYGFELTGFVVPGFSTLSQPSAQDLAALIDTIRAENVTVIFIEPSFDPGLAEAVVADTGVKTFRLITSALTPAGGEAGTYLEMIRLDVSSIVSALNGE